MKKLIKNLDSFVDYYDEFMINTLFESHVLFSTLHNRKSYIMKRNINLKELLYADKDLGRIT